MASDFEAEISNNFKINNKNKKRIYKTYLYLKFITKNFVKF